MSDRLEAISATVGPKPLPDPDKDWMLRLEELAAAMGIELRKKEAP